MNNNNILNETFVKHLNLLKERALGSDKPVPLTRLKGKVKDLGGQTDGQKEDDKLSAKDSNVPVAKMRPMQKEVIPNKALAFALGYLRDGKPDLNNMEAIAAQEGSEIFIMDGHHRWAGRTLIDPNAEVTVKLVTGASASDIVTALNMWSAYKDKKGNPGKGDVSQFAATIPKVLDQFIANGTDQWPNLNAEEVKQSLGKVPGAEGSWEKGKQIMIQNASKLPTAKHPDAPERVDMPVIAGQSELDTVATDLEQGNIDWKEPHSQTIQNVVPDVSQVSTGDASKTSSPVNETFKKHVSLLSEYLRKR